MNAPAKNAGGLLPTVKAVLWGFLGVRQRADFQNDTVRLKPLQLLAVGVVMAFVFVGGLMLLVNWVVG